MKNKYLHALSAGLILERDYDPVRSETGVYVFGDNLKVLSSHSKGANFIVELLDGDNLSSEEIQNRFNADQQILAADISGEITHLIGVYVFNGEPAPDKAQIFNNIDKLDRQADRISYGPGTRKYRSYFSVNIESRTIARHFQSAVPTDGLEKMLQRAFLAPDNFEAPPDIHQLLVQRNQEYRIALKTRKLTITYTLIAINVAVWLLSYLIPYDEIILWGAKINYSIALGQYWRLFTPIFLHGSEIHLLVNCYSLYA